MEMENVRLKLIRYDLDEYGWGVEVRGGRMEDDVEMVRRDEKAGEHAPNAQSLAHLTQHLFQPEHLSIRISVSAKMFLLISC